MRIPWGGGTHRADRQTGQWALEGGGGGGRRKKRGTEAVGWMITKKQEAWRKRREEFG